MKVVKKRAWYPQGFISSHKENKEWLPETKN